VIVKPTKGQIDDLIENVKKTTERGDRTLVTTLTKKMAEDLTEYLVEAGVRARYLHSEIDTLERIRIVRALRLGEFDVLVGVNLLREGLDLPEVTLVAILDADKEGFLRGTTSLIQTIGRAARNVNGQVIMYADNETEAMRTAIGETDRRRAIQVAYNEEHGIVPASIQKGVSDIVELLGLNEEAAAPRKKRRGEVDALADVDHDELERMIIEREQEMFAAAEDLRFELAARLRDEIGDLRREQLERAQAEGGDGESGDEGAGPRRGTAPVPRRSARRAASRAPRAVRS
jgi:excinuclease ABC subunit B